MKSVIIVAFLFPWCAQGQVGNTYKNYLHSDFADFFHTSEVKRVAYKKGVLREIKTGGFQDFITLHFYTDSATSTIHEATLDIDREWIGDETSAELARDLVKSFLLDFIAASDQTKAMPAGELLFKRKTTKDPFAINVADVFMNKKDSIFQRFAESQVSATNYKQDGKTYFRLNISDLSE